MEISLLPFITSLGYHYLFLDNHPNVLSRTLAGWCMSILWCTSHLQSIQMMVLFERNGWREPRSLKVTSTACFKWAMSSFGVRWLLFLMYSLSSWQISDFCSVSFLSCKSSHLWKWSIWCISQVIFDETLQRSIDSYLRYAPRSAPIVFMLMLFSQASFSFDMNENDPIIWILYLSDYRIFCKVCISTLGLMMWCTICRRECRNYIMRSIDCSSWYVYGWLLIRRARYLMSHILMTFMTFYTVCKETNIHQEMLIHFIPIFIQRDFLTPKVFGDILYENFIFDMPKLMDLCVLYGHDNKALLAKMLNNIFTQQPKYNQDLQETIPTIIQVRFLLFLSFLRTADLLHVIFVILNSGGHH